MKKLNISVMSFCRLIGKKMGSREGMELVQVAILIAIAVGLGIIFKNEITSFVNQTFESLDASKF